MTQINRRMLGVTVTVSVVLVASAAFFFFIVYDGNQTGTSTPVLGTSNDSSNYSSKMLSLVHSSFSPYFFSNNSIPSDLVIDSTSISYSQGVLIYTLRADSDARYTVSQQKLPESLESSKLVGDDEFTTEYGFASMSNTSDGRLTGSLVTNDGLFILINSKGPASETVLKDILRQLSPVK